MLAQAPARSVALGRSHAGGSGVYEPVITHELLFEIREKRKLAAAERPLRKGGISREQFLETKRLIAQGSTRQQTAQAVGISASSVSNIAKGHVPSSVSGKRPSEGRHRRVRRSDRPVCPTCDYRVAMPCVYCRALAYLKERGSHASA